jgi:metal-responsive CopG/Arc/MetJ family transcriptional regulator
MGMKTAVSLPDDVFHGAERFAKRARKTRSQLYAEAIAEYLARHAPDDVTEDMNVVVDRVGAAAPDGFGRIAARRSLERVEW